MPGIVRDCECNPWRDGERSTRFWASILKSMRSTLSKSLQACLRTTRTLPTCPDAHMQCAGTGTAVSRADCHRSSLVWSGLVWCCCNLKMDQDAVTTGEYPWWRWGGCSCLPIVCPSSCQMQHLKTLNRAMPSYRQNNIFSLVLSTAQPPLLPSNSGWTRTNAARTPVSNFITEYSLGGPSCVFCMHPTVVC